VGLNEKAVTHRYAHSFFSWVFFFVSFFVVNAQVSEVGLGRTDYSFIFQKVWALNAASFAEGGACYSF
jgi:hypothetical protein